MKPIKNLLLTFIILFISFYSVKVYAYPALSINDNDYELVCKYADGVEITITQKDVLIKNTSLSINSSSSNGIKFYLTSEQENTIYTDGGTNVYRHHAITESGKCPSKLYVYDLPAKYDDSNDSDDDSVTTLYYSTENGIEESIAGTRGCGFLWLGSCSKATQMTDLTTTLLSEEVYVLSSESTTACDYKIPSESAFTSSQVMSVLLYENLTVAEVNGYYSTVSGDKWTSCKNSDIYINDPTAKAVADNGSGIGTASRYYAKRFSISTSSSTCISNNGGKVCAKYEYLGARNSNEGNGDGSGQLCEVLGNETVKQIKRIVSILQILVPILTIALTTFDVGKLVVTGNLEEELPKRKKVIVARFIVMIIFFFLPLATNLIISALQDAEVIGVTDIKCILNDNG